MATLASTPLNLSHPFRTCPDGIWPSSLFMAIVTVKAFACEESKESANSATGVEPCDNNGIVRIQSSAIKNQVDSFFFRASYSQVFHTQLFPRLVNRLLS